MIFKYNMEYALCMELEYLLQSSLYINNRRETSAGSSRKIRAEKGNANIVHKVRL